jgi:hypothetical protein
MTTIYAQLAKQITYAIEAIPADYYIQPAHNIVVSDPDVAF